MLARRRLRLALFLLSTIVTLSFAGSSRSEDAAPPSPLAKGSIEKLDLVHKLLTLKTRDGLQTFTWTERTYIFRGKEKISADKLKQGEIIALRFYTDEQGQRVVQRIKAAPAEPPANPEPAK